MLSQIMDFFTSQAHAQADAVGPVPGASSPGGGISFLVMFVIFFLFIYFAIWRPQNKRAKEQQSLLGSLAKGDEVITAVGMAGRISKVADPYITLAITNNIDIVMQKTSVVSLLPKGTLKSLVD